MLASSTVGFRFGSAVRRVVTSARQPTRHMSIFTQRTGPLSSRMVVDESSSTGFDREPLSPVKKAQLSLLVGGAVVAFGTILYSGVSTKAEVSFFFFFFFFFFFSFTFFFFRIAGIRCGAFNS
jgi:hypothetical protein